MQRHLSTGAGANTPHRWIIAATAEEGRPELITPAYLDIYGTGIPGNLTSPRGTPHAPHSLFN
ncbi:hypothetical protein ACFLSW_03265 [Candidatus Bipolaricaulota bacterium]